MVTNLWQFVCQCKETGNYCGSTHRGEEPSYDHCRILERWAGGTWVTEKMPIEPRAVRWKMRRAHRDD